MRRNLDRRVEVVTPIQDADLQKSLEKIMNVYLNDNIKAWDMQGNGKFIQRKPFNKEYCAQTELGNSAIDCAL